MGCASGHGPGVAADAHAIGAMGRSELLDQGLPGLVLQFLQGGSGNQKGQVLGPGLKMARPFGQHLEHNLSHGGMTFTPFHPWPGSALLPVPSDTGNRPDRAQARPGEACWRRLRLPRIFSTSLSGLP